MATHPSLPKRVLVDLNAECNLKCPKCLLYGENKSDELVNQVVGNRLSNSMVSSLADQLEQANSMVGPALWSEPLLNPDFKSHISALRKRNLPVSINTNGLLLTEEISRFIVESAVESVCISIDAVTKDTLQSARGTRLLDKIEKNTIGLIKIRDRSDFDVPRIGVSFTEEPSNQHEKELFISKWIEIADFVRVGKVFDGNTFESIESTLPSRTPCPALYTTMAIQASGDVSICCLDAYSSTIVGNIHDSSVSDIWNGPRIQEVREMHERNDYSKLEICQNCQRWNSYNFAEYVEGNVLVRSSSEYTYYNRLDKMHTWPSTISKELHEPSNL